eukprot:m.336249 g.336249  ORF g.336249 m.336249 type:complete len:759 (-) comp17796_c0_seq1:132-2408(-)
MSRQLTESAPLVTRRRNQAAEGSKRAQSKKGETNNIKNNMEGLIQIVSKLQDVNNMVGGGMNLNLPQIVVVGSQSSGKSSVLEGLVGRDFLPRGTGIVTRVPLELHLNHVPHLEDRNVGDAYPSNEEWAEFLHKPGEIFTDFNHVREEIEARTVVLVGNRKNVANKPISLKIFSPNVLDLNLVDLPGITKVPVEDQPHDIEQQIRELVLMYITKSNALILAVSPANSDIANSDSLKISREVDPNGDRTIGVVTKLDLMDRGTDALSVLNGRMVCLKHGMIGVVNRGQLDIKQNKNIKDALRSEELFFGNHYPSIKDRCGIKYLGLTLNRLLMSHIRECLPGLKRKIKDTQNMYQKQLDELGQSMFEEHKQGAVLLQFLTNFSNNFISSIDGGSVVAYRREVSFLTGGAKICHIFHSKFTSMIRNMEALDGLTTNDIQAAIRNATGTRRSLFVPEMAFEILVRRQIHRLIDPALKCIELVFQEMESLIEQCANQEMSRVLSLRSRVQEVSLELLRSRLPETTSMVENLISIEEAYINTSHHNFAGGAGAMAKMLGRMEPEPSTQNANLPTTAKEVAPAPYATVAPRTSNSHAPEHCAPNHDDKASNHKGSWWLFGGASKQQNEFHDTPSKGQFNSDDYAGMAVASPNEQDRTMYFANSLNDREQVEVDLITNLIESYFGIVRDKIVDSVPKAIMHFLVNDVKTNLQSELVTKLWKTELFDTLLQEDPMAASQRASAIEMISALRKASVIVESSMFSASM